ncbi:MAG TPA: hypothetical protein VFP72_04665 [Kineosporiaceae bacterium]|nr:hypothetical protein [Kineosporiaceae bacterium]
MTAEPAPDTDLATLTAAREAEQRRLEELMAIGSAEGIIAGRRIGDLADQQKAAWRRVSAARGQLTKACKAGNAEKITAARRRLDTAYAEADRLAEDNITQMLRLNRARIEDLDRVFEQMGRTWDASAAVVQTLTQAPPPPQATP